jgi:PAS domain S-box-containing protein
MEISSHVNDELVHLFIVTAATIGAILTSIFSVSHGIFEVFPFLYILSIILTVYFYPRNSVLFSLCLSLIYIGLVYFFSSSHLELVIIGTAWFAIFNLIGVVTSSYANRLRAERKKIKKILDAAQDGIFCFDLRSLRLQEINLKCARMLHYEREDLLGKAITIIWPSETEQEDFLSCIKRGEVPCRKEVALRTKDGATHRYIISAILSTGNLALCFTTDAAREKISDEEIWQTLEDLERQVAQRTAHLEKINEDLKAEILRHKLAGTTTPHEERGGAGTEEPQ